MVGKGEENLLRSPAAFEAANEENKVQRVTRWYTQGYPRVSRNIRNKAH